MTSLISQTLNHKYAPMDLVRTRASVGGNGLNSALEGVRGKESDEVADIELPSLATANDLRELIRYLKKHPDGVTIIEALGEVKKRILDPRKISAYEIWGVVEREGDWLRLSDLGWEFSRRLSSEAALFRSIIDRVDHYRKVIGLIHAQQLKLITHDDIARFWRNQCSASLDWQHPKSVEGHVVCFLHLCQAADLGSLTVGKRGQPARLRIDLDEVENFIVGDFSAWDSDRHHRNELHPVRPSPANLLHWESKRLRIYLSLRQGLQCAPHLHSLLDLLGFDGEILERENTTIFASSEPIFETMRSCDAGIFVVTSKDCVPDEKGGLILNSELQSEISAGYLFYNKQILLLWDKKVPWPEAWQHLTRAQFDGESLEWEAGLELTKHLLTFKQ